MRVVYVINGLELGGAERLLVELACAVKSKGHDVSVYCLTRTGVWAERLRGQGIQVVLLRWGAVLLPGGWFHLRRTLKGADIVHTHLFYSDVLGALVRDGTRARLIATRHEDGFWMPKLLQRIEPAVYERFDAVVAVSKSVEASLVARGVGQERLRVVYPSIQGLPKSSQTGRAIILLGRLVEVKRVDLVIRAFASIPLARRSDWKLLIVGDGPERGRLGDLVETLRIANAVNFVGAADPEDVPMWLQRASVFVNASRSEGAPLSVMEAMLSGLACVAARVGGLSELMTHEHDGLLFDPADSTELTDCLAHLIVDEDMRRRLGAAARQTAQERFSSLRSVEAYLRLYQGDQPA